MFSGMNDYWIGLMARLLAEEGSAFTSLITWS